jgi:hypothetical protein
VEQGMEPVRTARIRRRSAQNRRAISVPLTRVTRGQPRVTRDHQGRLVSAPGSHNRCASQADSASSILVTRSIKAQLRAHLRARSAILM